MSCCAAGFEVSDDLFARVAVELDDEVDVLGEDRAGEDEVVAFGNREGEAAGDGIELCRVEADWVVLECGLLLLAQGAVMLPVGEGSAGGNLGRGAEQEQFPGAHEVGP